MSDVAVFLRAAGSSRSRTVVHRRILLVAEDNTLAGPAFSVSLAALRTLRLLFVAFEFASSTCKAVCSTTGQFVGCDVELQRIIPTHQPVRDRMPYSSPQSDGQGGERVECNLIIRARFSRGSAIIEITAARRRGVRELSWWAVVIDRIHDQIR